MNMSNSINIHLLIEGSNGPICNGDIAYLGVAVEIDATIGPFALIVLYVLHDICYIGYLARSI